MNKLILNYILLMTALLSSGSVLAGCATNRSGANQQTLTITVPDFSVQRDVPDGTILATANSVASDVVFSCTAGGGGWYSIMSLFTTPSGIAHFYKTNVDGVGVSIGGATTNFEVPAIYASTNVNEAIWISAKTVKFIKTGPITSGTITSGVLGYMWGNDDGPSVPALQYFVNGPKITVLACQIKTQNLTFPIGDIPASAFGSSVGATPAVAQNTQNLGLDCDPQANINVSLSGTQNPDVGTTSVLALSGQGSAGVAKGVGVQIVYNGSPLILNNNIVLKRSTGGIETFPLVARYYQTKTVVATGTANANATLNLTYQ